MYLNGFGRMTRQQLHRQSKDRVSGWQWRKELWNCIVELSEWKVEPNGITSFIVTLHRDANVNVEASSSADERVAGHYVIEPQEISEMVKPDKTVKILIVEDNPEMRKVLAQIFEQIYDVYTAADGQEGLEQASSLQPDDCE